MRHMLKELFDEAKNGKVSVECLTGDNWFFPIKCSLNEAKGSNIPVVKISNFTSFLQTFNEYLEYAREFYKDDKEYYELTDKGFDKKLLMDLLTSASYIELNDFERFVYKKTLMLKDNKVKECKQKVGKYLDYDIYLKIIKTRSNIEGPFIAKFSFSDNRETFELPSITFGIIDNKAYIMAIQFKGDVKNNAISKKLDRYFRKVNKGVDKEDEIAHVSPNSLISLTLFNSYLKQIGINEIEATCFMPVRYYSNKVNYLRKIKDSKEEDYDLIQYNITNKFMNLFNRYVYHFDESISQFDDFDTMHIKLKNQINKQDNIVYEIDDCVCLNKKRV